MDAGVIKTCSKCKQANTGRHDSYCPPCYRNYKKAWYEKNKDRVLEQKRVWLLKNKEQMRVWAADNKEKIRAHKRKSKLKNKSKWEPKHRAYMASYLKAWVRKHRGYVNARTARRYASKVMATPSWVDGGELKAIYELATSRSLETGVKHHVDHIVPLRSKTVCGLHVPWNLRVVPASENFKKSNLYWPDMP